MVVQIKSKMRKTIQTERNCATSIYKKKYHQYVLGRSWPTLHFLSWVAVLSTIEYFSNDSIDARHVFNSSLYVSLWFLLQDSVMMSISLSNKRRMQIAAGSNSLFGLCLRSLIFGFISFRVRILVILLSGLTLFPIDQSKLFAFMVSIFFTVLFFAILVYSLSIASVIAYTFLPDIQMLLPIVFRILLFLSPLSLTVSKQSSDIQSFFLAINPLNQFLVMLLSLSFKNDDQESLIWLFDKEIALIWCVVCPAVLLMLALISRQRVAYRLIVR
jgi:ABC-type polysaccharide/polyol phosphate export permease